MIKGAINMKDLTQLSARGCTNEISIRNQWYILSMTVDYSGSGQLNIQVEAKDTAEQWKSSFDPTAIETMTIKVGDYKPFHVFIQMLENAINQVKPSVRIDLLTTHDLNAMQNSSRKSSTKRYLILTDKTNYVLSLRHHSTSLPEPIPQLTFQPPENDQQIAFLRQMIWRNEEALIKAHIHSQRVKARKDAQCKTFADQIDSLKTSERQLKSKVKVLTEEISFLKTNCSRHTPRQPTDSTSDSSARFNPTAYVNARNRKIRHTQRQKREETRRTLSAGRCHSDSDLSDITPKRKDNHPHRSKSKSLSHTLSKNLLHHQSIDSDIERLSSPLILHPPSSNNSTVLLSPDRPLFPDETITSVDRRLQTLQKFYRQHFSS